MKVVKPISLRFLPIREHLADNKEFTDHPDCQDSIYMSVDFFKKVGYDKPWIGYYARLDNQLVGSAAFKGKPVEGRVEIAYGTFPKFQQQGIATEICRHLVQLSLRTDPSIRICARTLPEENYSTRVLRKNDFQLLGPVMDAEDGTVWEWEYLNSRQ